ncbi:Metallo-dependent phosphatase [Suillus decipiens]|nr:Metallo-dependent phosphatase [Suillus decipiens]
MTAMLRNIWEGLSTPVAPLEPPYRPLEWKDFNVIHTTDTHGWLLGHQKLSWAEPYYSGDLGDFSSFVTRMKEIAHVKDVDLLLIDTGDLHDGTGLSDGFPSGGVDAHESNEFLKRLPYDLMTIGNHELYNYTDAYDMYTNFAPKLQGRYLTSNVQITIVDSEGDLVNVTVGERFANFHTTTKGRRITSLGVMFNMTASQSAHHIFVQDTSKMVEESWFHAAITEEPDAFVLIGHIPVAGQNWTSVFNAVRKVHAHTPILIFGGHTHIRDCKKYDDRSVALQSGRFMETIGWMSVDLEAAKDNSDPLKFSRRYLDQNRVTYQYHTQDSNRTFDTLEGRSISYGLQELADRFDLSFQYGVAPQDYTLNQDDYYKKDTTSLVSFYIKTAVPYALSINNSRSDKPHIIISNSNALRSDLFKGSFTKNDQLSVMVYGDLFLYIPDVPFGVASQVLDKLNKGQHSVECNKLEPSDHSFGYVTKDECSNVDGDGDDTKHAKMPYCELPHYTSSEPPSVANETPIDLVFLDYFEGGQNDGIIISALNKIQSVKKYTKQDIAKLPYSTTRTSQVLGLFAQEMWK